MFIGGIFQVPIVPVCFAFATELTHPLSPALILGFMTCSSNLLLFGLQFGYLDLLQQPPIPPSLLPPPSGTRNVCIIMSALSGISFIASYFIKEDLRRLKSVSDMESMKSKSIDRRPSFMDKNAHKLIPDLVLEATIESAPKNSDLPIKNKVNDTTLTENRTVDKSLATEGDFPA